jgi:hypothetical protein
LLWEGREYQCPNWSDAEWPITSQNSQDTVEVKHQTVICICGPVCYFNDIDDDDDDSDDYEIQDRDLQASHGSYENDIDTTEIQRFFPTTNHNYQELHPTENDYSTQSSMVERTHQQNQGQESHELLSSV